MTAAKTEKQKHPLITLREHFDARQGELKNALPVHIPPERFIRVVMTAVQLNADLLACNRQSLWNACLKAASDGLLPDGREGAIVPFKDQAQWMPMVGGLLKRFRNSGQFKSLDCDIVHDGDEFEYWKDEHGPHMRHVPGDGSGKPIKAYAMAETKDGGIMIRVMTEAEINKRRNASRAKNSPLWSEWTEEAWMKTVLRNLAKRLPTSSDLDDLIRRDDDLYEFDKKPDNPGHESPPWETIKDVAGALDAFGGSQPGTEIADEFDPEKREVDLEHVRIEVQKAMERGRVARKAGHSRKEVPEEYRSVEMSHFAQAWWSGYDEGE
jgi:recombination protein RecT